MNYRLKRIQKGKPIKKTEHTDAIFENIQAVRAEAQGDPESLEIRLVYYPPYHSKYNPIERCWSSLQKKWNGVLLTCWQVVRACALRMTWNGDHPEVHRLEDAYDQEPPVSTAEMKIINARLDRSKALPKYDILIKPKQPRGR